MSGHQLHADLPATGRVSMPTPEPTPVAYDRAGFESAIDDARRAFAAAVEPIVAAWAAWQTAEFALYTAATSNHDRRGTDWKRGSLADAIQDAALQAEVAAREELASRA